MWSKLKRRKIVALQRPAVELNVFFHVLLYGGRNVQAPSLETVTETETETETVIFGLHEQEVKNDGLGLGHGLGLGLDERCIYSACHKYDHTLYLLES